ncbi:hypothetical protein ACFQY4_20025 [Catellatospora bangladeshensis]|uniref:hypothetical protein n=1 Tax=Catellatospora bangladeshensis TaxID=310355 RepID=UPI00361923FD
MKDERLVSEIAELLPEMESQLSGLPNGHARHDVSLLAETRDPITAERAVREALSRESRVEAIVQRLGGPPCSSATTRSNCRRRRSGARGCIPPSRAWTRPSARSGGWR